MNNKVAILLAVLIVLVGGFFLMGGQGEVEAPVVNDDTMMENKVTGNTDGENMEEPTAEDLAVKEFTVEGQNFSFSPAEMRVSEGDTIKVTFKNNGGFHDFVIDEFNVATRQASSPYTETIEFVASQAGSFEYYCSVGTHRQQGMVGTLIVE